MDWRLHIRRERRLLGELAMILVACLLVGAYFLERLDEQFAAARQHQMQSLARLTALNAREYLASDNRVSLNVIARQTASLDTVARLVIEDAAGQELASAGSAPEGPATVTRALQREDGSASATMHVWAEPAPERGRSLETGFVLVTLLLLVLRVIGQLVYRMLVPAADDESELVDDGVENVVDGAVRESRAPASAWMRISIVNFDRMQSRFTPSLLEELLREYEGLLQRVAGLYGAHLEAGLGARARLVFSGASPADAAFSAVCAGQLFLQTARKLGVLRKERGQTPLEFKVLVAGDADRGRNWSLCVAGLPGRVHVPAGQVTDLELDTRLLYHSERALKVKAEEVELTLQPVEQLAQRYQRLVGAQADKILRELGAGSQASQPS